METRASTGEVTDASHYCESRLRKTSADAGAQYGLDPPPPVTRDPTDLWVVEMETHQEGLSERTHR